MQERRTRDRHDLIYYFRVLDRNDDQLLGYAANISTEGVMLVGKMPTTPGKSYRLRMILPVEIDGRKQVKFEAISRWCHRNGGPGYFESGFQLDSAGVNDLAIIEHICSARTLESREYLSTKRLFDVVVASLGLLLTLPVFLTIGIAIRLVSAGPVFYIAKRVGEFGRPFRMYKFRTMTESLGSDGPRVTAHDDPRVTRVGRLLRKTKLNELPQLINVLKGEMSLVGPRPEYLEFVAHYSPEQREVLSVKPGVTSLASIAYVDEENMLQYSEVTETYVRSILPDKLRLDLLYVRNQSLLLDIDILLQTITVLIPRIRKAAPRVEDIGKAPFRLARQYLPWTVVDATISFFAVILASVLWRSASSFEVDPGRALIAAIAMTALFSISNWLTGVQRIYWRYASPIEAIDVVVSASAAIAIMLIGNSIVPQPKLPAQMLILAGLLAVIGFLVARYHRQLLKGLEGNLKRVLSAPSAGRERVLVVGAGDAGQLTISLLRNNPAGRAFHVVGVVDDDLDLLGTLVHRVPVLGDCERIPEIVREKDIGTIVFAIHSIEGHLRDHLLGLCRETGARTVIVPDLLGGLGQGTPRNDEIQLPYTPNASNSQAEIAAESELKNLHYQIRVLAEQARNGDTTGAAKGLGKLDEALQQAKSVDSMSLPKRIEPTSTSSDQISPVN